MKHLYLLRHAASASEAMSEDHEVPLSALGRRQATAMAAHLRKQSNGPGLVLCSSAVRARQTYELIAPALAPGVGVTFERGLYLAAAGVLLQHIHDAPESARNLLVVGHNPGLQQLAALLSGDGDDPDKPHAHIAMPPCALAALTVPMTQWRALGAGDAHLNELIAPRDLGA